MAETSESYVSVATNDQYAHGAVALGRSLRDTNTTKKLTLMITEQVTEELRTRLRETWDEIVIIDEINSRDVENLELIQRPELGVTFTKLHVWKLVQHTKCVFLDADTLVLTNVDELFEREELSAAPDIGWPDLFNSGVFVFKPSESTYAQLVEIARTEGSYDGGDQGLLNTFWSDWSTSSARRLPFVYNVVANLVYSYPPAFKRFQKNIKIIHFLGSVKPWHHHYNHIDDSITLSSSTQYGHVDYILKWWRVYCSSLPSEVLESSEPISTTMFPGSPIHMYTPSETERMASWEQGQPDYHGADQSDNIIAHITAQLRV